MMSTREFRPISTFTLARVGVINRGPMAGYPRTKPVWPRWFSFPLFWIGSHHVEIGKFQIKSEFPASCEKAEDLGTAGLFPHGHRGLEGVGVAGVAWVEAGQLLSPPDWLPSLTHQPGPVDTGVGNPCFSGRYPEGAFVGMEPNVTADLLWYISERIKSH